MKARRRKLEGLTLWSIFLEPTQPAFQSWLTFSKVNKDMTQDLQSWTLPTNSYQSKAATSFSSQELRFQAPVQTLLQKLSKSFYSRFCTVWNLSGMTPKLVQRWTKRTQVTSSLTEWCIGPCLMRFTKILSRTLSSKTSLLKCPLCQNLSSMSVLEPSSLSFQARFTNGMIFHRNRAETEEKAFWRAAAPTAKFSTSICRTKWTRKQIIRFFFWKYLYRYWTL